MFTATAGQSMAVPSMTLFTKQVVNQDVQHAGTEALDEATIEINRRRGRYSNIRSQLGVGANLLQGPRILRVLCQLRLVQTELLRNVIKAFFSKVGPRKQRIVNVPEPTLPMRGFGKRGRGAGAWLFVRLHLRVARRREGKVLE